MKRVICEKSPVKSSENANNVIWTSYGTEDWIWDTSDEEILDEMREVYDANEFDLESDFYDEDAGTWDYDGMRRKRIELEWDWDTDREDLELNVIPEIEKQCADDCFWLVGSYQRWDGGHEAIAFYDSVRDGVVDICYPNYEARTKLYCDSDNSLMWTESSHDAPMGGSAMTFYSFKNESQVQKAEDWLAEEYGYGDVTEYSEDFDFIRKCVESGWLTPIDGYKLFHY